MTEQSSPSSAGPSSTAEDTSQQQQAVDNNNNNENNHHPHHPHHPHPDPNHHDHHDHHHNNQPLSIHDLEKEIISLRHDLKVHLKGKKNRNGSSSGSKEKRSPVLHDFLRAGCIRSDEVLYLLTPSSRTSPFRLKHQHSSSFSGFSSSINLSHTQLQQYQQQHSGAGGAAPSASSISSSSSSSNTTTTTTTVTTSASLSSSSSSTPHSSSVEDSSISSSSSSSSSSANPTSAPTPANTTSNTIVDVPPKLKIDWLAFWGDCLLHLHKLYQERTLTLASEKYHAACKLCAPNSHLVHTIEMDRGPSRAVSYMMKSSSSSTIPHHRGHPPPPPQRVPLSKTNPSPLAASYPSGHLSMDIDDPSSHVLPIEKEYKIFRRWAVSQALLVTSEPANTPFLDGMRTNRMCKSSELFSYCLSATPRSTHPSPRARTCFEWACALRRISRTLEREGKLVDAFQGLRKASGMLRQALELRGHTYVQPLLKWGHLLDDMVSLTQRLAPGGPAGLTAADLDLSADLDLFLVFFSNRAMRDGGLTLKPLIALCLCSNKEVQRSSLDLLRHLSTFADDLDKEREEWEKERVKEVLGPYGNDVMAEAQVTLSWIEQIVLSNNTLTTAVKIMALRNLDDNARKFWKASEIKYAQALEHFEVFMNCLSFHTHRPVGNLGQRFFTSPTKSTAPTPNLDGLSKPRSNTLASGTGLDALFGDGAPRKRAATTNTKLQNNNNNNNNNSTSATSSSNNIDDLFKDDDPHRYYKDWDKIGKGGFGDVFIAREKGSRKRVAVKVLRRMATSEASIAAIVKEIVFMKSSVHSNIVSYIESFRWSDQIWIVMDYCDGGTLKALYSKVAVNEKHMSLIASEILKGLAFLHSQHRIHRDLKCDNILMNLSGDVKIADLGIAAELDIATANATAGVPSATSSLSSSSSSSTTPPPLPPPATANISTTTPASDPSPSPSVAAVEGQQGEGAGAGEDGAVVLVNDNKDTQQQQPNTTAATAAATTAAATTATATTTSTTAVAPTIVGLCGSKFWMAPEMIKHQPYNTKADIWSFGCLLLELADRQHPYTGCHSMTAMFLTATKGADRLRHPEIWSETFREFLALALEPEPDQRLSANQLLEHKFLKAVRDDPVERAHAVATLRQALEHAFIAQQFENMGMW